MPAGDDDDTVRLRRPPPRRRGPGWMAWGLSACLAAAAGIGWWVWPSAPPAPVAPTAGIQSASPHQPSLPAFGEADILGRSTGLTEIYRFSPQNEIVVANFASYAEQADALNRMATLTEKAGFPRDRIVPVAVLNARIIAAGETPQTFYYGHDYRAADLQHFFDVLDRSGEPPTEGETVLRRWLEALGWGARSNAALISLVQSSDRSITLSAAERATILRHELSHGLYFTSPAYSSFARDFYDNTLTADERGRFRAFLASEGYDTAIDDLVVNETQAYLMHTADPGFFSSRAVGIAQARIDVLRGLFLTGMPPGWLRDCTGLPPQ